ncbi:YqaE/Pmp3 family membrane protein [Halomonas sp. KAO]|uniref:YqaE/Pmp3 family membrane protein n=1 Tax=Halomonas sp. KAO TaxID=2783858 RepID=UPI00189F65F4|nr:YqaE/Pmp3 family membrane protein [Halomonas sp. KAO]MBF7052095.1 YqaE/Pmp3 family membrane protein [Halomonas sp. KAO]
MDAREYLARKGLDGERDRERPNTLEEKAWARARGAGDHRPRAGTPHDWEEWERYHGELAEGADSIDQKIDHETHRQALFHEQPLAREQDASAEDTSVGTFIPPAQEGGAVGHSPASSDAVFEAPPRVRLALRMLAILLPPLALGLAGLGARPVLIALALTLLGWVPGVIYAWWRLSRH